MSDELSLRVRIERAQGITVRGGVISSLGGRGYPGVSQPKTADSVKIDGRKSWVGRSRFGN